MQENNNWKNKYLYLLDSVRFVRVILFIICK
jgi:hypothetical protein